MGIRAIYTGFDDNREVEITGTRGDEWQGVEWSASGRIGDQFYYDQRDIEFPPHKTPADWQPEPCSCPLCLEDHAPDCAAQNCNNVPTPECTCGLVEE